MNAVFSENPENDLWRELLSYTYERNIDKYASERSCSIDEKTKTTITGSFHQAREYFHSAEDASLHIAPLLLYYGSINLFYGAACLFNCEKVDIDGHGMRIMPAHNFEYLADIGVSFSNPSHGGVHVLCRTLGVEESLCGTDSWTLSDFLDSIAEIDTDYKQCYSKKTGRILFLETTRTPTGEVERIPYVENQKQVIESVFDDIPYFNDAYLTPTDYARPGDPSYIILRRKMNSRMISERSFSGQPYLRAGHRKGSSLLVVPAAVNLYVSLFVLATLCRYHPDIWTPFVMHDDTGERLLVERLLFYARRMLPNIALNLIKEEEVSFCSQRYEPGSTISIVGEHQVNELIDKRLREQAQKGHLGRGYIR